MARRREIIIAGRPLRRWGKWSGVTLSLLAIVLLVGSLRYRAGYASRSGWAAGITGGGMFVGEEIPYWWPRGWFAQRRQNRDPQLWLPYINRNRDQRVVVIPFWLVLAGLGPATGWLFLIDGPSSGHCLRCGYDLAGIRGPACPECGREITAAPR